MVLEYVNGGELFDKIVRTLPLDCKLVELQLPDATELKSSVYAGVEG